MSVSYILYLDTQKGADDVLTGLASTLGVALRRQTSPVNPALLVSSVSDGPLVVTAWPLGGRLPGIAEETGVNAELGVEFELYSPESEEGKIAMVRALTTIMKAVDGDAVFHDIADRTLLVRKGGQLNLCEDSGFWTPELRAAMVENRSE
jgi:hypothetical protein